MVEWLCTHGRSWNAVPSWAFSHNLSRCLDQGLYTSPVVYTPYGPCHLTPVFRGPANQPFTPAQRVQKARSHRLIIHIDTTTFNKIIFSRPWDLLWTVELFSDSFLNFKNSKKKWMQPELIYIKSHWMFQSRYGKFSSFECICQNTSKQKSPQPTLNDLFWQPSVYNG